MRHTKVEKYDIELSVNREVDGMLKKESVGYSTLKLVWTFDRGVAVGCSCSVVDITN